MGGHGACLVPVHHLRVGPYDYSVLCNRPRSPLGERAVGVRSLGGQGFAARLLGLGTGLRREHHGHHGVEGDGAAVGAVADRLGQVEALDHADQVGLPRLRLSQARLSGEEVGLGRVAAEVVGLHPALAVGGEVRDAAVRLAGEPLGHEGLAEGADGGSGLGGDPGGHGGRLGGVGQDDGRGGDDGGSGSGHTITPAAWRSVGGECPAPRGTLVDARTDGGVHTNSH